MTSQNQIDIELPQFGHRYCTLVTVCVRTEEASGSRTGAEDARRWLTARYKASGRKAFVRLGGGGTKGHIHVDCALETHFENARPPEPTNSLEEVLAPIRDKLGQQGEACVAGHFKMPADALPKDGLVRLLNISGSSEKIAISVTGARLTFSGATIKSLEWRFLEDMTHVLMRMDSIRATEVSPSYLSESCDWVCGLFDFWVLERARDDTEAKK